MCLHVHLEQWRLHTKLLRAIPLYKVKLSSSWTLFKNVLLKNGCASQFYKVNIVFY